VGQSLGGSADAACTARSYSTTTGRIDSAGSANAFATARASSAGLRKQLSSCQTLGSAIVESTGTSCSVAVVAQLMAFMERAVLVVDWVAQLAECQTLRVLVSRRTAVLTLHASKDAARELRMTCRAVTVVAELMAIVGTATAQVRLVAELAYDLALERAVVAAAAGSGLATAVLMPAGAHRTVVVVAAPGKAEGRS
jgi:hypothetical protein